MFWDKLAIVDVETTGGRPPYDRVIEIGVVTVDYNQITGVYSQLINPQRWLPPEITWLTGIKSEELENQPVFGDLVSKLFPYLQDRTMVAHNARFDLSFLKAEFAALDFTYNPKHLCSVRLSRKLFPKYRSHALDRIIERFEIPVNSRHRALDDALVIWEFFKRLNGKVEDGRVTAAVSLLSKTPALPPQISREVIEKLPTAPGVYIFYDAEQVPLYVGKSINVKERVLSHFYSDLESVRERNIKEQIKNIEVIPAAGDLEAQLMEAKLVKELQPVYNRKLRVAREFIALTLEMNQKNYLHANLNLINQIPSKWGLIYGMYKSQSQAEETIKQITEENQLCWKLMGLENTKRACFGYHLGQCRGACMGKETAAKYNLRVLKAFKEKKLMDWPFAGAIAITEASEVNQRQVTHLFNNWKYVGTFEDGVDLSFGELRINPEKKTSLDLDTYKILKRYLQTNSNKARVLGNEKLVSF